MSESEALLQVWESVGGERAVLARSDTAHMVVVGQKVHSCRSVDGLVVESEPIDQGVFVRIRVGAGVRIDQPVHLCFGVAHDTGTQRIRMDVRLEQGAAVGFIAHCLFPQARRVRHVMEAEVRVGAEAEMRYEETHFHGPHGGVEVIPKTRVHVDRQGRYAAEFTLTTGRVGVLDLDSSVETDEGAVAELTTRIFGHGTDRISIRESIILAGRNAHGLIKSRIALEHEAMAEVTGITEGNAPGARGHVDCMEIVKDRAVAKAIPMVSVTSPLAKVTHEAAIGSVDRRQLETLMSHGLDPEQAVDLIVKGMLK